MLHLFLGTDRVKARAALAAAREKTAPHATVIHITDAHTIDDLFAALRGGGLFASERVVVLDGIFDREDMRDALLRSLPDLASSADHFFLYVERVDAAIRRTIEKHTKTSVQHDLPKKGDNSNSIFSLANALRARRKKDLWIGYQRELMAETASEAIHGVLFWAAKQMVTGARSDAEAQYGKKLVALLAELPHEARRQGVELEYPLERFVLSLDVIS